MNYRLIKKLPFENSPEIGYISKPHLTTIDNSHYWNGNWFNPEKYPEFWEKVVEKDYEILSIKYMNNIYQLSDQNIFRFNDGFISLQTVLNKKLPGIEIYSVKRLSDNQIFTIGDNIKNNEIIKSIQLIDNQIRIYPQNSFYYLKDIVKVKIPLFQTFDKVDIFESDEDVYYIDLKNLDNIKRSSPTICSTSQKSDYLFFKSKEKAEEYILLNKPCLSYNEVLNAVKIRNKNTFDSLKELIKQKLK